MKMPAAMASIIPGVINRVACIFLGQKFISILPCAQQTASEFPRQTGGSLKPPDRVELE